MLASSEKYRALEVDYLLCGSKKNKILEKNYTILPELVENMVSYDLQFDQYGE